MRPLSFKKMQDLLLSWLLIFGSSGTAVSAEQVLEFTDAQHHVDTNTQDAKGSSEAIRKEKQRELMNMSLEELMEVPITTVASKREEKVTDAPGIVKVYPASEIEKYGYYNLHELAQITAGYYSLRRYDLTGFVVRGLPAGGWDNNKVLVLVDGIPVNQARNYHGWAEEELPLYFADRVEFLKGPASALYGTSAFLGVINITSKGVGAGESLYEAKMSGGNDPYNSRRLMANAIVNNGDLQGRVFAGYFGKDARRDIFLDSMHMWGATDDPHYSRNYDNSGQLFLNTSVTISKEDSWLKGFTPGFIMIEHRGGLGTGWMGFSHQLDDITYRSLIPYLKYQRQLTDNLGVDAFAKYQGYSEEGTWSFRMENDPNLARTGDLAHTYRVIVPNFESKVDFIYDFSEDLNVIVGANYDVRYEKGGPEEFAYAYSPVSPFIQSLALGDSGKFETFSYYAQLQKDFDILKGLTVTLGGRYDQGEAFEKFSPRVGLVQHITKNLGFKALYGTALKSPGVKEYVQNLDVGGSLSINPESIETFEVSLVWSDSKVNAAATYFNNKIEDPIARVVDNRGVTVFGNDSGNFKSQGVELEGEWLFTHGGKLFANTTLQDSHDETGSDIPLVPSWTGNLGVAYDIKSIGLTVASVLKCTGDYTRQGNDYVIARNGEKLEGATTWDMNLIKEINKNTRLELQVKNLLDTEYYHPGEDSWQAWDYLQPGRTILLTLSMRF